MKFPYFLCIALVLSAGYIEAQNNAGTGAARAAALYEQGMGFIAEENW